MPEPRIIDAVGYYVCRHCGEQAYRNWMGYFLRRYPERPHPECDKHEWRSKGVTDVR